MKFNASQMQEISIDDLSTFDKHPKYYQNGGDLIVVVGGTIFRVASIFFTRESEVFRHCLSGGGTDTKTTGWGPQLSDTNEDCTPLHTIVIQLEGNVTPDDFAQLCGVFFNPRYSLYDNTLDGWKAVLRLATQWHFSEVKKLAIRQIHALRKHNISPVSHTPLSPQDQADPIPPFGDLTESVTSDLETAAALRLQSLVVIASPREQLRPSCSPVRGALHHTFESMRSVTVPFIQSNDKPLLRFQEPRFVTWVLMSLFWAQGAIVFLLGVAPFSPGPNDIRNRGSGTPGKPWFQYAYPSGYDDSRRHESEGEEEKGCG